MVTVTSPYRYRVQFKLYNYGSKEFILQCDKILRRKRNNLQYDILRDSVEDKEYFKYLLYTLGIVDRWKQESFKAIKQLESLTGNTWENPYNTENEKLALRLTDNERTLIENRIKDGYYTSESIKERQDQKKREEYEKKRNEIIADCEKEIQKAENRKLVRLAILNTGIPLKM